MADKKPVPKPNEVSRHQQYKDFFKEKIEKDGFQVSDKNTFNELKKTAWADDKLNVARGSRHDVTHALREVMQDLGIKVEGVEATKSSGSVGNLEIKLSKSIDDIKNKILGDTQTIPSQPTSSAQPIPTAQSPTMPATHGALPQQQTQEQQQNFLGIGEVKQPLDPHKKEEYERLFQRSFGLVTKTYIQLGFVEGEAEQEKPMTADSFKKEVDGVANDWAHYCFEHNISLPTWLELAALVLGSAVVFGSPILRVVMQGKKKKEKESKLKNVVSKTDKVIVFKDKDKSNTTEKPQENTIDAKNEAKSGINTEELSK